MPQHHTAPSHVRTVIPHRQTGSVGRMLLLGAMSTLALHHQSTVSLEIARTETGKHFLVRANDEPTLVHLEHQIQARYPQAEVGELDPTSDPLSGAERCLVSAIELTAGAAAYQPLRTFHQRALDEPGADPLLSVLAALDQVPSHLRVVVQLALSPLPSSWSRRFQHLAYEHPLAEEQQRARREERRTMRDTGVSWQAIFGLMAVVAVLSLWQSGVLPRFLPDFLITALARVLHGQAPGLTPLQTLYTVGGCTLFLIALVGTLRGITALMKSLLARPLYDPRRVAEKLSKSAYRAQLRIFVIDSSVLPHTQIMFPSISSHLSPGSMWLWVCALSNGAVAVLAQWWKRLSMRRSILASHHIWLHQLVAAYTQYHADAYFVPRSLSRRQVYALLSKTRSPAFLFGTQPGWTDGMRRSQLFLSGEEVAMLWHLPQATDLVGIGSLARKEATTFPVPRLLTSGAGWKLGASTHAGTSFPVYFPPTELARHMLVLGRTGKGKSTLYEHLVLASLTQREPAGLCVVEPHGDLILRIASHLPVARQEQLFVIDLSNQQTPPGINPLDMSATSDPDRVASTLVSTLKHIWKHSWGSRVENVTRFSLLTLAYANQARVNSDRLLGPEQQYTLLDIVPLLTNETFRLEVLRDVSDVQVLEWWQGYYEKLGLEGQADITTPVITKLSAYASSPVARRIIGQPHSTLWLSEIVKGQGTVLMNTARGRVGQDISSLLGATVMGLFAEALTGQLALPEEQRRHWMLLVDEFGNYPVNYEQFLSELRKARLSVVLAAQSLAQLDEEERQLRPIVVSNVDHLFTFTLSGDDAVALKHELGSALPEDVVTLPDHTCYAHLTYGGSRLPLFSLILDLPPKGDLGTAQTVLQRRSHDLGTPSPTVDAELERLAARYRESTPAGKASNPAGKKPGKPRERTSGPHSKAGKHIPFGAAQASQPASPAPLLDPSPKDDEEETR